MKKSVFDRIAERILLNPAACRLYSEKVKKELHLLYPSKETALVCHSYYRDKISFLLKIWFIGLIFLVLMLIAQASETILKHGNEVVREDASQSPIALLVSDADGNVMEIEYEVQTQILTKKEVQEHTERFINECEKLICGENESLSEVYTDLMLQKTYETYPMEFSWESSDYRLVGDDGAVANEELTKEQEVQLTAIITYGEEEFLHTFSVQVIPPRLSETELWEKQVLSAFKTEDEKQKYEETIRLPSVIGGKEVVYKEKKDDFKILFFLMLPVVSVVLFYAKDRDLEKETELRKRKLTMKYPEFVSKLQLLLGAGMTVKNIFLRLSEDETLGKELTEETELMLRDIRNGIPIRDALDRFGKRTANPLYIKFSALLIQNMKKGTDDLTKQLSKEAAEAFILRKTNARQLGEEVGTKLLGPMILMLGIVMAILIIPAFLSFQF